MADSPKPDAALAGETEASSDQTPRKTSSLRKAGSKLKKAFTPRKHSASSEDLGETESPSSEGSDKKKAGFFRKLTQKARTPRGKDSPSLPEGEEVPTAADTTEEKAEKEAPAMVDAGGVAKGVAGAVAESKPAEGLKGNGEGVAAAQEAAKDKIEEAMVDAEDKAEPAADGAKETEAKGPEAAKGAVPEAVFAAPAASIHAVAEAVSREVEAAQVKVVAPVEGAVVTRDVELSKPVQETKKEKPAEAAKEPKISGGRRRRPLIPLLGIAIGITFIAIRMVK